MVERMSLLQSFSPLLAVILAIIAFVFYNGSIVVGKRHHFFSQHNFVRSLGTRKETPVFSGTSLHRCT